MNVKPSAAAKDLAWRVHDICRGKLPSRTIYQHALELDRDYFKKIRREEREIAAKIALSEAQNHTCSWDQCCSEETGERVAAMIRRARKGRKKRP